MVSEGKGVARRCLGIKGDGTPCGAPPLRDGQHCFWHAPATRAEAQEARRLGGLRRRREHTLAGVYDLEGVTTLEQIRRVVEIAILDTLELPNSIARNRTLGSLAQTAQRILETDEFATRLEALEGALQRRPAGARGQ